MDQFEIKDIHTLTWAFRKLSELNEQKKEKEQLAEAERERISSWLDADLKPINDSISYFEGLIQAYHAKLLEENPKLKTLSTPYGKAKSRQTKETIEKVNEDELLNYVTSNGLNQYIKNSVKWADLKKDLHIVNGQVINDDGEIVPGLKIKPASVSFSVEV
ncbi:MAG: host-nuclease inhibitor Gam family protein [Acutalibacteraceae bacterium]